MKTQATSHGVNITKRPHRVFPKDFHRAKNLLENGSMTYAKVADLMDYSLSTIARIAKSKDYESYADMVDNNRNGTEHSSSNLIVDNDTAHVINPPEPGIPLNEIVPMILSRLDTLILLQHQMLEVWTKK